MSIARQRPAIPPGPRTYALTAHVPEALHAAAHLAAEADGYASLSEWLGALVAEQVRLDDWRRELASEHGLDDEPTEPHPRALSTLPPEPADDETNPDQPLEEGR